MASVKDLPAVLQDTLGDRDIIVFDGECVLCSGFFEFVLKRDREGQFSFATAQSPLGQQLYKALGLPTEDYETNLVIVKGRIYQRLDAACAAIGNFNLFWRMLGTARFLPDFIKSPLYFLIARNRYRIFGRFRTCMMPSDEIKSRFLKGGYGVG